MEREEEVRRHTHTHTSSHKRASHETTPTENKRRRHIRDARKERGQEDHTYEKAVTTTTAPLLQAMLHTKIDTHTQNRFHPSHLSYAACTTARKRENDKRRNTGSPQAPRPFSPLHTHIHTHKYIQTYNTEICKTNKNKEGTKVGATLTHHLHRKVNGGTQTCTARCRLQHNTYCREGNEECHPNEEEEECRHWVRHMAMCEWEG